jgi:hypothetical protein
MCAGACGSRRNAWRRYVPHPPPAPYLHPNQRCHPNGMALEVITIAPHTGVPFSVAIVAFVANVTYKYLQRGYGRGDSICLHGTWTKSHSLHAGTSAWNPIPKSAGVDADGGAALPSPRQMLPTAGVAYCFDSVDFIDSVTRINPPCFTMAILQGGFHSH